MVAGITARSSGPRRRRSSHRRRLPGAGHIRDGVTTEFELEVGTGDIDRWYAAREGKAIINYGVSVGHIPVRMAVMKDPGDFLPSRNSIGIKHVLVNGVVVVRNGQLAGVGAPGRAVRGPTQ